MTGEEPLDPQATAAPRRRPAAAGRQDWSSWPHYDAAAEGFRGYWYPVTWSSHITGDPRPYTICGEKIVLIRDGGTAYALHDRCPHRGVPLSQGDQQFPGTISCPYHGWTYDLPTGRLAAVITDGPDSRICGKVMPSRPDLPGGRTAGHGLGVRPGGRGGPAPDRRAASRGTGRQRLRDGRPDRQAAR
ncbi:Rieske 2Fe-2S domain-containing protein [Actinomadura sp. 9N407]|uniref:Rieske 2Fe-2S domain-containing protein n=1 Tax=Actinomadura sp. 9N407 TaxID=3375154 RepID=UPI0037874699